MTQESQAQPPVQEEKKDEGAMDEEKKVEEKKEEGAMDEEKKPEEPKKDDDEEDTVFQ